MACCCQRVKALKCFRTTVKELKTQKDLPAHWVTPLVEQARAWLEGDQVGEASFADLVDRQNKLQQAVQQLFDRKVPAAVCRLPLCVPAPPAAVCRCVYLPLCGYLRLLPLCPAVCT